MPPERRENELKIPVRNLLAVMAPGYLVFNHQDVRESGHPDWSISGDGKTTWWEFKHGVPDFDPHGLQLLTCQRLARASFCRYIIWQEGADGGNPRTLIVHPDEVRRARREKSWDLRAEQEARGFGPNFIVCYILGVHRGTRNAG